MPLVAEEGVVGVATTAVAGVEVVVEVVAVSQGVNPMNPPPTPTPIEAPNTLIYHQGSG